MKPATAKTPHPARHRWTVARRIVQCGVFALFLAPLLLLGWAAFGLTQGGNDRLAATPAEAPFFGTLSSSQIFGVDILDPFGAVQLVAASKTVVLDWLLFALPVLVFYALIRGRAFCGWVCPVNLLLEGLDWARGALRIPVRERAVPRRAKVFIAGAVVVVSFAVGVPVFETFSPISALNKGVVLGSSAGVLTLVAVVVAELFWGHRVWCRSLCPLGGFYQAIGRIGFVGVAFERSLCTHCDLCKASCIADPEILDPVLTGQAVRVLAGDCMVCGKCVDACPTRALALRCRLPFSAGTRTASPPPSGQKA